MTMKHGNSLANIVTITDANFVLAVYVLVASLRYHGVTSKITVLTKGLGAEETALFQQFQDVRVVRSDSPGSRNPCTLKGEAILAAAEDAADFITLLDGDGLVTGNITQYLTPSDAAIYSREKSPEELANIYRRRYEQGEKPGAVPRIVLNRWKHDVGERDHPRERSLIASGNLTLHRSWLAFARKWHEQMLRVLPDIDQGSAHDFDSIAYQQTDESVLNSLLLYAHEAPQTGTYLLNKDPEACVVHLGPYPKYWVMWSKEKLRYLEPVLRTLEWAQAEGYKLPKLTWCLKRRNKPLIYLVAYGHFLYMKSRKTARSLARFGPKSRKNSYAQHLHGS